MPNIELLEKSIPVAPIKIAALPGCEELAREVDQKLVRFRKELAERNQSGINPQGYSEESFLIGCEVGSHPMGRYAGAMGAALTAKK